MAAFTFKIDTPLQSWDIDLLSGSKQKTAYFPSTSAIIGLIANSLGHERGQPLGRLKELEIDIRIDKKGQIYEDYQIAHANTNGRSIVLQNYNDVINTQFSNKQKTKNLTWIRRKEYLTESIFTIAISHDDPDFLKMIHYGLTHPARQLYAGRKCCPLSIFPTMITDTDGYTALRSSIDDTHRYEIISMKDHGDTLFWTHSKTDVSDFDLDRRRSYHDQTLYHTFIGNETDPVFDIID